MIAGAKRERTPTDDDKSAKKSTGGAAAAGTTTTPTTTMAAATATDAPMEVALDENLHSRQLAVYGREVMQRMATSNVLISGANGLGLEIGESRETEAVVFEGGGSSSLFSCAHACARAPSCTSSAWRCLA